MKTGDVDTLWILDDRTDPVTAARTGSDASVCGDCPHRTGHGELGDCYVTLFQAPGSVYRGTKGKRPTEISAKSKVLRLGGYGDPAMLPDFTIKKLVEKYDAWLGYTHQWRHGFAARMKKWVMASADSLEDKRLAVSRGWRTFRVAYDDHVEPDEIVCPATTHGVTCAQCKLCCGASKQAKNIVILAHGSRSQKHLKMKV